MQQHQIKRKTQRKRHRVIGRGGKHAKTAGRGTKGQKARAGRKLRPELRDILKKLPKLRGRGKNSLKSVKSPMVVLNLKSLSEKFSSGESVTVSALYEKGLIKKVLGRLPEIKILGDGEIGKKISVVGISVSESAKKKIESAGGSVS